jgi:hypothetical protein
VIPIATEIIKRLVDDLDGKSTAENTVNFSFGDRRFVIDLSDDNFKKFEAAIDPYVKAARPQGRVPTAKRATKSHHAAPVKIDDAQAQHVREWARGKDQDELRKMARTTGLEVADRGRLSMVTLAAAYNVANPTKRVENANGLQFSNA